MPQPFSAIPGPKGLPFIGSLLDYTRFGKFSFERMHLAKQENYKKYGKIYREKLGRYFVNIFDPEDVEKVCRAEGKYPMRPPLTMALVAEKRDKEPASFAFLNGEPWWRIRKAVQTKMMSPVSVQTFLHVQNTVADDLVKLIDYRISQGQGQGRGGRLNEDVTEFLYKYTMEAFGAVCFNVRIGCLHPEVPPSPEALKVITSIADSFQALQLTAFAFPWYAIYRTKLYKQYLRATRTSQRIVSEYVDKALKANASADADPENTNFLRTLFESNSGQLTKDELVRLTIDLFNGGIDSTANALSFCLFNLASNPEKQKRLASELDSLLGPYTGSDVSVPVSPEVLNEMRYVKACVTESFRLYFPVEGGSVRELTTDLVLSDYHVPKGTLVAMNCQTMCLQDKFFDNPDQYIPERWLRDGGDISRTVSKFIMLPFGHGSRMCIGRRFAEQEIYLALIKIFHRFRVELDSKDEVRVGIINRLFSMPDTSIPLLFIPRSS